MTQCEACGNRFLFGGVKEGTHQYCSAKCVKETAWTDALAPVPAAEVEQGVKAIHEGACPKCQGPGPVDVHTSYKVYSILIMTRWSSHPILACQSCAQKQQLKHTLYSLVTGWWGFPFGLILTPIQIVRNIGGLIGVAGPDPMTPSPALCRLVRLRLAARKKSSMAARAVKTA
jgi:hypothetical protein